GDLVERCGEHEIVGAVILIPKEKQWQAVLCAPSENESPGVVVGDNSGLLQLGVLELEPHAVIETTSGAELQDAHGRGHPFRLRSHAGSADRSRDVRGMSGVCVLFG